MASSDLNSVILVGRLTRAPELKSLPSGAQVCELGLAVNESFKTRDGDWEERVNFFDVSVWGGQGESCSRYLDKGRQVAIQGRLRWESWEREGQRRSKVTVVANRVQFLSDGRGRDADPDVPIDTSGLPEPARDEPVDIPF